MVPTTRRAFFTDVGRGMLAAGLGASLANDLGFSTAFAEQGSDSLQLGEYTRLVELMRNTPAEKLQPALVELIQKGETDLKTLIGAGALANAVTFGGCDYVGFHTAMAMLPALEMSRQMTSGRQPLPVLKVLYRNAQQIQSAGTRSGAALAAFEALEHAAAEHAAETDVGVKIRNACRDVNSAAGEKLLAEASTPQEMFNLLQPAVQDDLNVHRFVFAHRTYGLVGLLGKEYAHSILSQCVRLCCDHERMRIEHKQPESPIRALIPKLLDQYKLAGKSLGKRDPGDAAIDQLCNVIYEGPRDRAAEAAAAALAEGIDPEISAKRFRWRRTCSSCVRGRIDGELMGIPPASIRQTQRTPGEIWLALVNRVMRSRA